MNTRTPRVDALDEAGCSQSEYVEVDRHDRSDSMAGKRDYESSSVEYRSNKAGWSQSSVDEGEVHEVEEIPRLENVGRPSAPYDGGQYATFGTGWPAMARIIREVDEQKIQNYEKDIDGILIFAGLFSAAMTAFLVESYRNLSQDPAQVTILLMQQLAIQTHSYSLNGGFLNSTAPPLVPIIPPFEPTANAIRVNTLWFASLTLTLVSASFSILVKQWLREFLAGEHTSPQARIRIRHFRNPGLDDWKVFEIAGALPLLLQLSLALFLIGLCFFTAEVHHTLGYTTLPLVAGWGFLILAVSCAPALSPRCPYKTALLKSTMKRIRKCLFSGISSWTKNTNARNISQALTEFLDQWQMLLSWDEEHVARSNSSDIDILIAVDTIQSDDRLFDIMLSIILESMGQSQPGSRTESLFKLLEHRCKQDADNNSLASLDLSRLPSSTLSSVIGMVTSTLRQEIDRQSVLDPHFSIEWTPWMEDCIYILFYNYGGPGSTLTAEAHELFAFLLADENRAESLFKVIASRLPDPDAFLHVLVQLGPAIKLSDRDALLRILASLMRSYFCRDATHAHNTLMDITAGHPEITSQYTSVLCRLVLSLVKTEVTTADSYHQWTFAAQRYLLYVYSHRLSPADSCHAKILDFIRFLLMSRGCRSFIIIPMMTMYDSVTYHMEEDLARQACIDAATGSKPEELHMILDGLVSYASLHAASEVFSEPESHANHYVRVDPLRACLVFLRLLYAVREHGVSLQEYASTIRSFWTAIEGGLRTVARMRDLWKEDYFASATRCLELINALNSPQYQENEHHNAGPPWMDERAINSLIPHTLVESIAMYLPAEDAL